MGATFGKIGGGNKCMDSFALIIFHQERSVWCLDFLTLLLIIFRGFQQLWSVQIITKLGDFVLLKSLEAFQCKVNNISSERGMTPVINLSSLDGYYA